MCERQYCSTYLDEGEEAGDVESRELHIDGYMWMVGTRRYTVKTGSEVCCRRLR